MRSTFSWFLYAGLVVGTVLPGCDCGSGDAGPDDGCTTASDCDTGFLCVGGECIERPPEEDAGTGPRCIDEDRDGFGENCDRGFDCDDGDPEQRDREICDGLDNDCDGVADNGVLSECGDCDPTCSASSEGPGTSTPFMPDEENSEGVGLDDDGAISLNSRRVNTNYIWIANTGEGTVSRFSTEDPYEETGRYVTGMDGASNDPSRTSVASDGDVYVANRGGQSVSRISILGEGCPDTNGDGMITTSMDGTALPWGQDDCVLWNRELPGPTIRAVAAQDVVDEEGELQQFVWVGSWTATRVYKLDGRTGEVLLDIPAPVQTYGFALDGMGNLWISGWSHNTIARIDTTRCISPESCAMPGVTEVISVPQTGGNQRCYGITVDFMQRVWCGGDDVRRYDPSIADPAARWSTITTPFVHGIAADAEGFVYAAASTAGIIRVNGDTLEQTTINTGSANNKGMAVDSEGKIWSITRASEAIVIVPGAALTDNTVIRNVATSIVNPYTYSDMTGVQLRLATDPRGHYRTVYEGCPDSDIEVEWGELRFNAETPAGTRVIFRARTAATRADLETAEWITLTTVPDGTSPADVGEALAAEGIDPQRWLMIEAQLQADRSSTTEVVTPRVLELEMTSHCEETPG